MDTQQNKKHITNNLLIKAKLIYCKSPVFLRFLFLPVKLILKFLRKLRVDLWIIEGKEITTKQNLVISYFGTELNKNFFIKLAFDNSCKEKYIGKTWICDFNKKAKKINKSCSLIIAEIFKSYSIIAKSSNFFSIPCWIDGEMDISSGISSFINNDSVKTDIRKIRKNKLDFEITNDLSQFHSFYQNMYLPYITKVHGDRAFINKYDFFEKKFKNCDLLLISKDKECIAGTLIAYEKDKGRVWCVGVKDGDISYLKMGAIASLYYFTFNYLKEKGFKRAGFGLSRAFLKDGVLQFKRKRGAQFADISDKIFLIKPLSKSPGVKGFLLNNPFFCVKNGKLNGAIFMKNVQSLSEEDFDEIYNDYYLTGMSQLFIYLFDDNDDITQEIIPFKFKDKIKICSAEGLFK